MDFKVGKPIFMHDAAFEMFLHKWPRTSTKLGTTTTIPMAIGFWILTRPLWRAMVSQVAWTVAVW